MRIEQEKDLRAYSSHTISPDFIFTCKCARIKFYYLVISPERFCLTLIKSIETHKNPRQQRITTQKSSFVVFLYDRKRPTCATWITRHDARTYLLVTFFFSHIFCSVSLCSCFFFSQSAWTAYLLVERLLEFKQQFSLLRCCHSQV